jgi:hypothetical protein
VSDALADPFGDGFDDPSHGAVADVLTHGFAGP